MSGEPALLLAEIEKIQRVLASVRERLDSARRKGLAARLAWAVAVEPPARARAAMAEPLRRRSPGSLPGRTCASCMGHGFPLNSSSWLQRP